MERNGSERLEVPVAQREGQASAGGALKLVGRLDEEPLEARATFQEFVEKLRVGKYTAKYQPLRRTQPRISRKDHARFQEYVHDFDAARAVGRAGTADEALGLGGTLSGEHGIGIAKSRYMEKETSRGTIVYSRRLKAALDPKNILNPGKIIGG
jgi:hypothetical protein